MSSCLLLQLPPAYFKEMGCGSTLSPRSFSPTQTWRDLSFSFNVFLQGWHQAEATKCLWVQNLRTHSWWNCRAKVYFFYPAICFIANTAFQKRKHQFKMPPKSTSLSILQNFVKTVCHLCDQKKNNKNHWVRLYFISSIFQWCRLTYMKH